MKLRVVTLCSGYDSQCLALERLKENFGIDYELAAWAEFDPESKRPIDLQPAVVAHNALFPQWKDRNMGDITKADWSKVSGPIDLLCYSTPCQSISNAGKQHGFKADSGTRSSVIWAVLNAIEALKPRFLLLENVAAMVSQKFISDFHDWQKSVEALGYTNYTQLMNAKDYGIPQNRNRVFMVSVRNGEAPYFFPEPFPLTTRLKDVLEPKVDESYYLSEKTIQMFNRHAEKQKEKGNGFKFSPTDGGGYASSVLTAPGTRPCDNYIIDKQ